MTGNILDLNSTHRIQIQFSFMSSEYSTLFKATFFDWQVGTHDIWTEAVAELVQDSTDVSKMRKPSKFLDN